MKAKDALAQCRQTIKSHPKQVAAIAAITVVAVALICAFCLRGCDSNDAVGESSTDTASQTSNDGSLNVAAIEAGLTTTEAVQSASSNEEQNADAAAGQSAAENGFVGSDSQPTGTDSTQAPSSAPSDSNNVGASGGSNNGSSSNNESVPAAPSKSGLWTIRRFGFRTPQRGMNPFQRMVTKKNQSAMFAAQTLLVMKLLTARPT